MNIDIAVGRDRFTKTWTNKSLSWEELINRIKTTVYTHETLPEYLAMTKARQDEIKDVGGFVGGYLDEGQRHVANVRHRHIVSLDLDAALYDTWDIFSMVFDCKAAMHSTHKHSKATPRYRILIPLSRAVTVGEYEPIARAIAKRIGIKMFDRTTFQVHRFMYWPSTSKNAEYVFESQDGNLLDVDKILSSYVNWKDVSSWPLCPDENAQIKTSISQQEDPLTKSGLIGAFCRAYSINEAISKFIPNAYEASDDFDDRYTYLGTDLVKPSTSGGAICYDDKFLYSWHNTDPAGNQCVNAFDLVRIHKFGMLDTTDRTDTTKTESFKKMNELVRRDPKVIQELGVFKGIDSADWLSEMKINNKGDYVETINNVLLILKNDPAIKDLLAYNQFENQHYIMGSTPWISEPGPRPMIDDDDAAIRHYLEKKYSIFQISKTKDAIDIIARENGFHPVREYIESLAWDGKPRIETIFIDAFESADTPFVRAVSKKTLVACINRIMVPGCKFDYVLTLVGPQGFRKSTIVHELGAEWTSDTLDTVQGKDAYEQLQGNWLIEMAELSAQRKADVESMKHFITKRVDKYRVAYGHRTAPFPRQCIFFGSTNEVAFLKDATGNRRFWPIVCRKRYEGGMTSEYRDQVWAEAYHYYKMGEPIYLDDELEKDAAEIQRQHFENDERTGLIQQYLETPVPVNWKDYSRIERISYLNGGNPFDEKNIDTVERDTVCIAEIWVEVLKGDLKDMGTNNTKFIHAILQTLEGWAIGKSLRTFPYGVQRTYYKTKIDQLVMNDLEFLN